MPAVTDARLSHHKTATALLLFGGILIATLTEAIASTVLSLGRNDMLGDIHATPDEFAWLDVGYTASKLIAFMASPWLMSRIEPRTLIVGATLVMGAASGIAAVTTHLTLLIAIRIVQGLSGGLLLVVGQAIIFLGYPRARQPILQALFAMGAVVAPATITPAFQGLLLDCQSWTWIFLSVIPLALVAAGLLMFADTPAAAASAPRPCDWIGLCLISVALFCLTYVFIQGARWDWFEEPRIRWLTIIGVTASVMFIVQQILIRDTGLLDLILFASKDFSFAFIVSFVAGAALFGSAFLIPAFAVSALSFTPTDAGLLLLPSGGLFIGSLLIAAFIIQAHGAPPIATVPFGIVMVMMAMWMLSGSTSESGADDMMRAVLLRGVGLGFLFLSITLIAFSNLAPRNLGAGIGLFNTGRQLGGLLGVAALQTLINHHVASNSVVLGTYVVAGNPTVIARLKTTTTILSSKGLDAADASHAAMALLVRAVVRQSTVIAFDTAFIAIALLFVVAVPAVIAVKVGLSRHRTKPR
jgi:DHA2 family multidrug resistance protein